VVEPTSPQPPVTRIDEPSMIIPTPLSVIKGIAVVSRNQTRAAGSKSKNTDNYSYK
jgi:hypothetical protein